MLFLNTNYKHYFRTSSHIETTLVIVIKEIKVAIEVFRRIIYFHTSCLLYYLHDLVVMSL